jgi:ParB family chromosome partitioning protein
MSPTSCRRSGRRASARPCSSGAKRDGYGIVAGRRRFFALQQIAKETGSDPLVPCAVMVEGDAASAIEASIIENVARLPATEMEQYTAFRKLHDEGRPVEEIAAFFGVTELNVRRVLALAALSAPIRKLYADEEDRPRNRPGADARHTCPAGGLAEALEQRDRARPDGAGLPRMDHRRSAIITDKALFDLAGYTGAVTPTCSARRLCLRTPRVLGGARRRDR